MQQRWRIRHRTLNFNFCFTFRLRFPRLQCVDNELIGTLSIVFVTLFILIALTLHVFFFRLRCSTRLLFCSLHYRFAWIMWKDFVYTWAILFGNRNRFEMRNISNSSICGVSIILILLFSPHRTKCAHFHSSRHSVNRHSDKIKRTQRWRRHHRQRQRRRRHKFYMTRVDASVHVP